LTNPFFYDIIRAQKEKEIIKMTMNEIAIAWEEWLENHEYTSESVNDFCNIYATSYEEYTALYELLADALEEN
jgi:hypothetical protein